MVADDYGIPVHEFGKNPRKRICIHVQEYQGSTFLDIREFYLDREAETWKPTKKGVTIAPELYGELLQGVVAAAEALGVDMPDSLEID